VNASKGSQNYISGTTHNITLTNFTGTNIDLYLNRTGFTLNAFDELNPATNLTFNATIWNTTTSISLSNQTGAYSNSSAGFPSGNVTVQVSKTGWSTRTYYATVQPTVTYTEVNAYLLQSGQGVWATFYTIDTDWNAISNVTITFSRLNSTTGTYFEIGEYKTDSFGVVQQYLDPTTEYQYVASKAGYTTKTGYVTPIATTYYIVMGAAAGQLDFDTDYFYAVITPNGQAVNTSTGSITFQINDPLNNLSYYYLNITNSTHVLWSNNQTNAGGGWITASLNGIAGLPTTKAEPIHAIVRYYRYGRESEINHTYYAMVTSAGADIGIEKAMLAISEELNDTSNGALAIFSIILLVALATVLGRTIGMGAGISVVILSAILAWYNWIPWAMWVLAAGLAILVTISFGRRVS